MKACLILLLAAVLTMSYVVKSDASPQLNRLATQVAGMPVTVQCFNPDGYSGYVESDDGVYIPVIHLASDLCSDLQGVLVSRHSHRGMEGEALLALTHQATNLALSSDDEPLVACTAYHNVYNAARLLPVGWKVRNAITAVALKSHEEDIPEYRSVC